MALSDYNNSAIYTFTNARSITSGEWSVPKENELATFGGELGITTSNYSGYGLKAMYWSSSANASGGYCVNFSRAKSATATTAAHFLCVWLGLSNFVKN